VASKRMVTPSRMLMVQPPLRYVSSSALRRALATSASTHRPTFVSAFSFIPPKVRRAHAAGVQGVKSMELRGIFLAALSGGGCHGRNGRVRTLEAEHMRILIIAPTLRLNDRDRNTQANGGMARGSRHEVRVVQHRPITAWKTDRKVCLAPVPPRAMARGRRLASPAVGAESPGGFTRILHLLSFAITSVTDWMGRYIAPELVLTVAPRFVCAPPRCSPRAWFMEVMVAPTKTLRLTWPLDWVLLKGKLLAACRVANGALGAAAF